MTLAPSSRLWRTPESCAAVHIPGSQDQHLLSEEGAHLDSENLILLPRKTQVLD